MKLLRLSILCALVLPPRRPLPRRVRPGPGAHTPPPPRPLPTTRSRSPRRSVPGQRRDGPRLRRARARAHRAHEPDPRGRGLRPRQRDGLGRALRRCSTSRTSSRTLRGRGYDAGRARLRRRDRLHPAQRVRVHRAARPGRGAIAPGADDRGRRAEHGRAGRALRARLARVARDPAPRAHVPLVRRAASRARTFRSGSSTGSTSSPASRRTPRTSATVLNTPAARQMLAYHFTSIRRRRTPRPIRCARRSIADLAAVGDYPAQPRLVAFANGSGHRAGPGLRARARSSSSTRTTTSS